MFESMKVPSSRSAFCGSFRNTHHELLRSGSVQDWTILRFPMSCLLATEDQ